MLWTIIGLLFIFWLLGLFFHIGGGIIHILLVIAVIVLIVKLVKRI
ncbi:lmo0937 family membrane protein [Priestia megaterium]